MLRHVVKIIPAIALTVCGLPTMAWGQQLSRQEAAQLIQGSSKFIEPVYLSFEAPQRIRDQDIARPNGSWAVFVNPAHSGILAGGSLSSDFSGRGHGYFTLTAEGARQVSVDVDVTGVLESGEGRARTEFTWRYQSLPEILRRLAVHGGQGRASFERWDDGWRITEIGTSYRDEPFPMTTADRKKEVQDVQAISAAREAAALQLRQQELAGPLRDMTREDERTIAVRVGSGALQFRIDQDRGLFRTEGETFRYCRDLDAGDGPPWHLASWNEILSILDVYLNGWQRATVHNTTVNLEQLHQTQFIVRPRDTSDHYFFGSTFQPRSQFVILLDDVFDNNGTFYSLRNEKNWSGYSQDGITGALLLSVEPGRLTLKPSPWVGQHGGVLPF